MMNFIAFNLSTVNAVLRFVWLWASAHVLRRSDSLCWAVDAIAIVPNTTDSGGVSIARPPEPLLVSAAEPLQLESVRAT